MAAGAPAYTYVEKFKYEQNFLFPGSFLTSQNPTRLEKGKLAKFSLEQEVVDKTGTKKIFHCKNYEKNETEDDCLNNCLVKTFVEEFGCLHTRLKVGKSQHIFSGPLILPKNEQKNA